MRAYEVEPRITVGGEPERPGFGPADIGGSVPEHDQSQQESVGMTGAFPPKAAIARTPERCQF